jgi:nicotinamidase-related amidase
MNIALLVIDMQKAFFYGSAKQSMENAAKYVNYIVDLFRNKNKKIIWIQDENIKDGNIKGTEGFEIIDLLEPRETEKRLQIPNGS